MSKFNKHIGVKNLGVSFRRTLKAIQENKIDLAIELINSLEAHKLNYQDLHGWPLIFLAAEKAQSQVVEALLSRNVNIEFKDTVYNGGRTLMHVAAQGNLVDLMELLLKKGFDINTKMNNERIPLSFAAQNGNAEAVAFLLKNGADIYSIENNSGLLGTNILHNAAQGGMNEFVVYLVEKGLDVNSRTNSGETPLYQAAMGRHNDVVKTLLLLGTNASNIAKTPNHNVNGCYNILHAAAMCGLDDIILQYLSRGFHIEGDLKHQTPLYHAINNGHESTVKLLIQSGADLSLIADPLNLAANSGNIAILSMLLDKGYDIDVNGGIGYTPLCTAARYNKIEVVEYLVQKKANIDIGDNIGYNPLLRTIGNNCIETLNVLVDSGANVNVTDKNTYGSNSALFLAVQYGREEISKILLKSGADINFINEYYKNNMLHAAAQGGIVDMIPMLLAKGFDVNSRNNEDYTPLHLAAQSGYEDVIALLIQNGAFLQAVNKHGETAFHCAARSGWTSTVELLLDNGFDVNKTTLKTNISALHLASGTLAFDLVELLLKNGANIHAKDNSGRNVLHCAAQSHVASIHIIELLLKQGADINVVTSYGYGIAHSALTYSRMDVFKIILKSGYDIAIKDTQGRTALDLAILQNKANVINYLKTASLADRIYKKENVSKVDIEVELNDKDLQEIFVERIKFHLNHDGVEVYNLDYYSSILPESLLELLDVSINSLNGAEQLSSSHLQLKHKQEYDDESKAEYKDDGKDGAEEEVVEKKIRFHTPDFQKAAIKLFPTVADMSGVAVPEANQAIRHLAKLISEGNERLSGHNEKAILLMGNTGVGKTTLAYALANKKLQAIMDHQSGELVLVAMQPIDGLVIGHTSVSETKVPNRANNGDVVIWDCPGFNDTNPVQEIANSFYIKKLVTGSKSLKLMLVVSESSIVDSRGINFVQVLKSFMHTIDQMELLADNISLIVTQVVPHKLPEHLVNSITKILDTNQQVTEPMKHLIVSVLAKPSLYLFHKPRNEGEYEFNIDLLNSLEHHSNYVAISSVSVNIFLSRTGAEMAAQLLATAHDNMNQLASLVWQVVVDPECERENILTVCYERLVRPWLPQQLSRIDVLGVESYFPQLKQLKLLHELFAQHEVCQGLTNVQDGIKLLQDAVGIMAKFADINKVESSILQDYAYILGQQYEYIKFFTQVSVSNGSTEDFHQLSEIALTNLRSLARNCKQVLEQNMEDQVKGMQLESTREVAYYIEAIEYYDRYPESKVCHERIAQAHVNLGQLAELQVVALDADNVDYRKVIWHYAKALAHDKHLIKIYNKLGSLFMKQEKYAKAIECYKVLNDSYHTNKCFKAWLTNDEENPEIWLQRGDYSALIAEHQKAKKYYQYAFSLSEDEVFKEMVMHKMANALRATYTVADQFDRLADNHNFYNFASVNDEFIAMLLGTGDDEYKGGEFDFN